MWPTTLYECKYYMNGTYNGKLTFSKPFQEKSKARLPWRKKKQT